MQQRDKHPLRFTGHKILNALCVEKLLIAHGYFAYLSHRYLKTVQNIRKGGYRAPLHNVGFLVICKFNYII